VDRTTNKSIFATTDDNSPVPWNYNSFTFSVISGATYGLTAGILPLYAGEYNYKVYEWNDTFESFTLSTAKQVEIGILTVEKGLTLSAYKVDGTFKTYRL
jgi:hypothetical protein